MKKIFLFITTLAFFAACNDLDVNPLNGIDQETFIQSDQDAILAINGVYAALVESESVVVAWNVDLGSDASKAGDAAPEDAAAQLSSFNFHDGIAHTYWAWGDHYYGIANATFLINKLNDPATPVSDKIRKRVRGEAEFLRAYFNFLIVQIFGEVPLIIESGATTGVGVERDPVQTVYAQIEKDLINSAADLSDYPTSDAYGADDKGRITQQSAYGLLSKAYLTWAQTDETQEINTKLDKAVEYANKVTGYELEQQFGDNWHKDNRYGKESLFSANYVISQQSAGNGGNHLTHCAFSTGFEQQSPHSVLSDRTFFDRFDDRDQRKLGTFLTRATNPDNGQTTIFNEPRYAKYIDPDDPARSSKNRELNATILRYAEVLLVKAEAINERYQSPNPEAYEAINKVRRRAYKVGEYADGTATATLAEAQLPAGLDYRGFQQAVRRERLFELTYEQVRWFDLKRWKVLVKTVKRVAASSKKDNVASKHYRFPLPKSQRDLNDKLWQNWGYEGSKATTPPYADPNYEGGPENNDGWTETEIAYLYSHISTPQ
ncbi:membrane protein [Bacteroidia bacterium]|nr:membrane protein [Bacteroidia bacterium]